MAFSKKTFAYSLTNTLLKNSICPLEKFDKDFSIKKEVVDDLYKNKIRYIVIHDHVIREVQPECKKARAYITKFFEGDEPSYIDEDITVYDIYDLVEKQNTQE